MKLSLCLTKHHTIKTYQVHEYHAMKTR